VQTSGAAPVFDGRTKQEMRLCKSLESGPGRRRPALISNTTALIQAPLHHGGALESVFLSVVANTLDLVLLGVAAVGRLWNDRTRQ